MKLLWSKQLSVGNVIIDSEHRNLIYLVNDVIRAIETRVHYGLALTFEQLEHALCVHFSNEEKLAQAISFDFSKHRLAQQYGLKELRFLRSELVAKDCLWSDGAAEHFTRFLKNWMIDEHIIGLDMQMKPLLQTYDYEFWPNLSG
ncbi:MAG: hemerythrin family protein [Gallionella sp.]